jgi:Secretion system C-terminal sorting domain
LVRKSHDGKSGYGDLVTISIDVQTGNIAGKMSSSSIKNYLMHCFLTDVKVIDDLGKPLSAKAFADSATIEYSVSTGTTNISFQNQISIQPNPVSEFLKINKPESLKIENVKIENLLGQEIMNVQNFDYANHLVIDVSSLKDGVYFVNIISKNGNKIIRKIVVEH